MPGTLYIVSTPIGNLGDITIRALEILTNTDLIACEDTRHTKKILEHYKINNRLTSYHEHNEDTKSEKLLEELQDGKDIALVSDAGTPCISDPGFKIIKLASENGVDVVTVPGASSVISSITLSGLSMDSFSFFGFLPRTKKKISALTESVKKIDTTLIFFESPKRISKSLELLIEGLGNRNAALCREMTKIHEEVIRGTLEEIGRSVENKKGLKGELCLVVEGFKGDRDINLNDDLNYVRNKLSSLNKINISLKDAVKVVSQETEVPKKVIYQTALNIWDK